MLPDSARVWHRSCSLSSARNVSCHSPLRARRNRGWPTSFSRCLQVVASSSTRRNKPPQPSTTNAGNNCAALVAACPPQKPSISTLTPPMDTTTSSSASPCSQKLSNLSPHPLLQLSFALHGCMTQRAAINVRASPPWNHKPRAVARSEMKALNACEHGDRKGRHYYRTAPQATSFVNIVVATLAVAMFHTILQQPWNHKRQSGRRTPYLVIQCLALDIHYTCATPPLL